MATGIVGVGAALTGLGALASVLVFIATLGYACLVAAHAWRLLAYRAAMGRDLRDPRRAFGYFTFVAGTDVVAVCLAAAGRHGVATALLIVALTTWLVLGYAVPWTAVLGSHPQPVLAAANGSWFIWVVASRSVAVVAATLQPVLTPARSALAVVAVLTWSVGLVLYAAAAVFVSLRLMLYELTPEELDPTYWVSMGAVAITVVAGARVVEMLQTPIVDATRGLVAGLSVVLWSFASWLIPVLVAVGVWRHVVHRVTLRYVPAMWSIVFPLGMYAVAGMYLGQADRLPFVEAVGRAWFWVGLAAWVLAAGAMTRSLALSVARGRNLGK